VQQLVFGSLTAAQMVMTSKYDKGGKDMTIENLEIECPKCGEFIDINEQISHQLKEQSVNEKKRIEIEIKREVEKSKAKEIASYKSEIEKRDKQLRSTKDSEIEITLKIKEMEYQLETQNQIVKIERQKAALEARKEEAEKYEKMAEDFAKQKTAEVEQKNTNLQMKNHQLEDQMRQQKEMHQEALRKVEQGSVQTQGEGGEIYIEGILRQAFPEDEIQEVAKGEKGADIIQKVRFSSGIVAGIIVWEGKRAKGWSNSWISKVKEDTVRVNGHVSVIVSEVSKGAKSTKMTMIEENVWVCNYNEILGLATSIRSGLIRAAKAIKSQEGKGTKMELLYDYMSGQDFANAVRMVNDSYIAQQDIIAKERRAQEKHWKSREKANLSLLEGFADFMGTIKTIATELPAIKEIEGDDQMFLSGPDDSEFDDN